MKSLALSIGVSVVTALHQAVATEASVGNIGVNRIVLPWDPRDIDLQATVSLSGVSAVLVQLARDGVEGDSGRQHCTHQHSLSLSGSFKKIFYKNLSLF